MSELKFANSVTLSQRYHDLHAAYCKRPLILTLDPADKENLLDADWKIPHYFAVGDDALRIIVNALIAHRREPPRSILDFPSGSGRVTRHLCAFFPETRIVASDLYPSHVDFCRTAFGVTGRLSQEDLSALDFQERFDLIFCGSLLTHLPEPLFMAAIDLLIRSLSDRGIAVVTLQGRHSVHIQRHKWKYLDDRLFDIALEGMQRTGFGYVDYDHDFRQTFDRQARYGITLIRPDWVMQRLQATTEVRILSYTERDWDDHQDVLVFGKPPLNAEA